MDADRRRTDPVYQLEWITRVLVVFAVVGLVFFVFLVIGARFG